MQKQLLPSWPISISMNAINKIDSINEVASYVVFQIR